MVSDVMKSLQGAMDKATESLKRELAKIRTGRANLSLLDGVKVDYYGTLTPLNQVASCQVADPKLITIKPWEKSLLPTIEKAIKTANLGLNPNSDGELIRLPIPALTQDRRKELAKMVKKEGEDAKVAIRNARREANEALKALKGKGTISEDDEKKGLKSIQDAIDKQTKAADDLVAKKEKEIMEV